MPEEAKPNRRRAVIVCAVFAVVLAGTIYLLRTNLAYLKWRFVGGEPELIHDALETGAISLDQVVALVNSGATTEVRYAALGTIAGSSRMPVPYDDRIVEAILQFAADLPGDGFERAVAAQTVAWAVGRSERPELVDVLGPLAEDRNPNVRMSVLGAFRGAASLGEESLALLSKLAADKDATVRRAVAGVFVGKHPAPEWAASVVRGLLDDADVEVRQFAVHAACFFRSAEGANPFAARLREVFDSPEEDERVRSPALGVLFHGGFVDDDELAALASDPQKRVAETAKRFIEWRAEESEEARDGASADE